MRVSIFPGIDRTGLLELMDVEQMRCDSPVVSHNYGFLQQDVSILSLSMCSPTSAEWPTYHWMVYRTHPWETQWSSDNNNFECSGLFNLGPALCYFQRRTPKSGNATDGSQRITLEYLDASLLEVSSPLLSKCAKERWNTTIAFSRQGLSLLRKKKSPHCHYTIAY